MPSLTFLTVVFWQVQPPSFSNKADATGRIFEALYPKVSGPDDTRHFVEQIQEEEFTLNVTAENLHADKFKDF